jgi:hypothetical protein
LEAVDFFLKKKLEIDDFFGAPTNRTVSLQIALLSRQIAFISRVQFFEISEEFCPTFSELAALAMLRHLSSATEALA